MKEIIILSIETFHLFVAVLLLFGGYIIPLNYIPVYLLGAPFMTIDWNDQDGLCHLTKLRNMIRYESLHPQVKGESDNNFIHTLLLKLGINMSYTHIDKLLYVLITTSWLDAYSRFIQHKHIQLFPTKQTQYMVISIIVVWFIITFI